MAEEVFYTLCGVLFVAIYFAGLVAWARGGKREAMKQAQKGRHLCL